MWLTPAGDLEYRPAIVRSEIGWRHVQLLGHDAPARPANAATTPAATTPAAIPAQRHIDGRSLVVTTGSGGNPYTSGSSSSKKNAPAPPIPSSGSAPYSLASLTPAACSSSSLACPFGVIDRRAGGRSTSCTSTPGRRPRGGR